MSADAFDNAEFQDLLDSLLDYHSIFYKFWKICRPVFSKQISTASVSFNANYECIDFSINPDFWKEQSDHNKKFIICHECWHIINLHSYRVMGKITEASNKAMDIVVNESLVKYFGFNRKEIDPKNEYCWLNTCFESEEEVEGWHNFEYYLNKLKQKQESHEEGGGKLISPHDGLNSIPQDMLSDMIDGLSEEEVDVIHNIIEDSEHNSRKEDGAGQIAGQSYGGLTKEILRKKIVKKKKWETVIKKFEKKIKITQQEDTHWIHKNRRLANLNFDLLLPCDIEDDTPKNNFEKISTWFFMDTSGSCWSLADRFFTAAKSLDPNVFDVKYFFFDTKVYPANIKSSRVLGGGGTSFQAISRFIYSKNQNNPYVWVLTDGFGDDPKIPENQLKKWNWFLSEKNGNTNFIDKKSKIYYLQDFE